ncbi:TVP38/TMEM64 family protein [Jiella avicenniae]|uniref:TVP38/TMEM64 family membrane protein n=1 Tax=Jiella avicenniae TaxID=2907202 RepID=A0A9X1NZT2_9HYPH|nr:TVP38/TMEM64 family protein [Jiella avicenniae]MCE7027630.1 TVP38/TMEM64 family protein [Jiella avicenniae]MCE7028672.1 TVP38/TMEM64 family protein [Jiella avicenniae]
MPIARPKPNDPCTASSTDERDRGVEAASPAGKGRSAATPATLSRFLPLLVLVAVLVLAYAFGLHRYISLQAFLDSREQLKAFVGDNLVLASLGFVFLYAGLVAVSFPAASLVTVASGFLFGWLVGGTLTVIGATLGATILFLAARTAFGDVLRRKSGGAIARFAEGFRDDAFTYLLLLRLTPVLPFFVVNVAPAFFDVTLGTYVATTFLGIIPGSMAYAFLGSGLDQALVNAGENDVSIKDLVTPEMTIALVGLAVLAILGVVLKKTVLRKRTA